MSLWQLPIMDGPVPMVVNALALALALVLLIRRWRLRSLLWAVAGAVTGAVVGAAIFFVMNALDDYGDLLPGFVLPWAVWALAGCGFALGGLVGSRRWRALLSFVAAIVFLIAAALGINAGYGLNPTLGTLFGMATAPAAVLPDPAGTAPAPAQPLYQSWTAPAGMPATGSRGSAEIPATASGFDARAAGIYLPPAALVPDAPALPLVIMMMGYPGNPDPTTISNVLDRFAAQHGGLAPIVIVADQIGASGSDPACADSVAFGKARTYLTVDVVDWARKNLRVIDDPAYWTIAGYSNGGGCAIAYAATYPQLWRNAIVVSGEEYPGSEQVDEVIAKVYGGDRAAFEASKPVNIMKAAPTGALAGSAVVFTAGADDVPFSAAATRLAAAATAAGMSVTHVEIPGQGHTGAIVELGLAEGFTVLYPVLGLSP